MSSSTVSITPRRSLRTRPTPTPTTEKKPGSDRVTSDRTDPLPASDDESTREEAPDRSIKPSVTETGQTQPPKSRKRTVGKKGNVLSASRPTWKVGVSVVGKNLGLVVILLVLVQMIRRLGFDKAGAGGFDLVFGSEYERRVAETERLVKTTAKMMQVQVEVVDRKIEKEIAGLRSEMGKRIDGVRAEVANRFSGFDGRVESVEKALGSGEWLTRDEFDRFMVGVKERKGDLKLDEVRALAREIVEEEIGKHAADGIGRVDYALGSGGGMVVKHSEAFSGGRRVSGWFAGNVRSDAVKMLQPSFGQPGECFPLKGDNGFVEIKLRTAIVPEAITLEHVSKSVAFDTSTAPKDCKVWGLSRNEEGTQKEHLLTEFTYDLEKSSIQTFNVLVDGEDVNPIIIDTIRLQFMSNHGSPTHTCVYRVRVHGHLPNVS